MLIEATHAPVALSTAHRSLLVLHATAEVRNIRQVAHLYPQVGRLLDGTDQLPPLPEEPLASVVEMHESGRLPRL